MPDYFDFDGTIKKNLIVFDFGSDDRHTISIMIDMTDEERREVLGELLMDELRVIREYVSDIPTLKQDVNVLKEDVEQLKSDMTNVKFTLYEHDVDLKSIKATLIEHNTELRSIKSVLQKHDTKLTLLASNVN